MKKVFLVALLQQLIMLGETRAAEPHRTEPLRFAIAGEIHFDDDGMSDLATLRSIVSGHGGNVIAVCASDGTVTGIITKKTHYLIVGTPPAMQSRARSRFVAFISRAKTLGVDIVPLSRIQTSADLELFKAKPAPFVLKLYRPVNGGASSD